jgi:hypothetical protein
MSPRALCLVSRIRPRQPKTSLISRAQGRLIAMNRRDFTHRVIISTRAILANCSP